MTLFRIVRLWMAATIFNVGLASAHPCPESFIKSASAPIQSIERTSVTLTGPAYPTLENRTFYGFLLRGPSTTRSYIVTSERALYGVKTLTASWKPAAAKKNRTFTPTGVVAFGRGLDLAVLEVSHREVDLPAALSKKPRFPREARPDHFSIVWPCHVQKAKKVYDRSAFLMGSVSVFSSPALPPGALAVDNEGNVLGLVSARTVEGPVPLGIYSTADQIRSMIASLRKSPPPAPRTALDWSRWIAGTWYGLWYGSAFKKDSFVRKYFLRRALEKNPGAYAVEYDLTRLELSKPFLSEEDLESFLDQLVHVESYVPADPPVYLDQAETLLKLHQDKAAQAKIRWVETYYPQYIDASTRERLQTLASQ